MKQFVLSLMLMFAVGATAQVDDMYFVPKKSEKKKVQEKDDIPMQTTQERFVYDTSNSFDEDEYNRRGYLSSQNTEETEEYAYEEEETYSLEEVADEDYSYSSRILRFHSPRAVMVSSPWYWDIVYTSGVDSWLVCDDGIYWDIYPTYNYYSSWYYPAWSWSFTFGYWGYYNHYCWNHWYSPVWHGHHHHYYPHWHGAHHNHGYWGGTPAFSDNRRKPVIDMRTGQVYSSNNRGNRSSARNDKVVQSGKSNTTGNNIRGGASNDNNNGRVRTGRSGRTTSTGVQRVISGENNRNRATVKDNRTPNRTNYRGTTTDKVKRERRTGTQKNSSDSKEKVYNRPSSTRTTSRSTNVERSSSNTRSSSSISRGGSSRSSAGAGGGGSRSGGSRGGRR